jgi:hypothetical protein
MLSLENCRSLLGADSERLEDGDLELLRDQLYCLARLSLEAFSIVGDEKQSSTFHDALTLFEQSERECIEERAAVIEFDGKIARETAERIAVSQAVQDWNN